MRSQVRIIGQLQREYNNFGTSSKNHIASRIFSRTQNPYQEIASKMHFDEVDATVVTISEGLQCRGDDQNVLGDKYGRNDPGRTKRESVTIHGYVCLQPSRIHNCLTKVAQRQNIPNRMNALSVF